MAKEDIKKKKKGTETEIVKEEKKPSKKQIEKENIKKERKEVENKIDALLVELKHTKEKETKKEIKKEINRLKQQRSNIGKKDTFLGDVRKEMDLVRWPSAKEVVKYSIACLAFVLLFALFFYGIDAFFALVKGLIK